MTEQINRKINFIALQLTFVHVYLRAWVYSHIHRKKNNSTPIKKIAAIWYGPPDLPGSNLRLGNWKSLFEEDGYRFDNFHVSTLDESINDFGSAPWSEKYKFYKRILLQRYSQFLKLKDYDTVWIDRGFLPYYPLKKAFFERCIKRMVRRLVIDCFDGGNHQQNAPLVLDTLNQADIFTVAYKPLLDFYSPMHPHVIWINWTIPTTPYLSKTTFSLNDVPVLGWMGSPENMKYLKAIEGELQRVSQEVKFKLKIICREPIELSIPGAEIEYHEFADDTYYQLIESFDIGLCPFTVKNFSTTGKIAMKHLEFMLCGIPQVCSPVALSDVTIDEENALIANSIEDWSAKLLRMMEDEELRAKLGQNAKKTFFEHYTYEKQYPKIKGVLTDLEIPN